jgi:release factor glutamine methyltransferase
MQLEISPEVFHPGFFFSTQVLLNYINQLPLQQKTLLELGCGSGLIAMVGAEKGAIVTASDISPAAVAFLKKNCIRNNLQLNILESDMFTDIPQMKYDIIAINPPYYKKDPVTMKDHAWFCGTQGEYFERLFTSLHRYIHAGTETLMILFDGSDMNMIHGFAAANNFVLNCVQSKKNILEKNFIFKIAKTQ